PHAELTPSRMRPHAAGRRRVCTARGAPPPRGTDAEPHATARGWPQARFDVRARLRATGEASHGRVHDDNGAAGEREDSRLVGNGLQTLHGPLESGPLEFLHSVRMKADPTYEDQRQNTGSAQRPPLIDDDPKRES